MNDKKKSEVLAFFWLIISVLTFLALFSYKPDDIPFEVSTPNSPVRNFVGIVGAYSAWALILLFGRTAYFLAPLFLVWAFTNWAGKKSQPLWLKIFSTIILLMSSCALFSLLAGTMDAERFQSGGLIGYFSSNFFSYLFGGAGVFVALSLFILSVILATELLVLQIAANLFHRVQKLFLSKTDKPSGAIKEIAREKGLPILNAKRLDAIKETLKTPLLKPQAKPEIRFSMKPPEPKDPAAPKAPVITTPPTAEEESGAYALPALSLLESSPDVDQVQVRGDLEESSRILEDTLQDFGIEAKVVEVEQGPTITRYELQPAAGVKVGRITSLENDIALAMRATSVRIVAPIPGKSRVGIEVPNTAPSTVCIRDVLSSPEYQNDRSKISVVIGKDTAGSPLVANLADMPHLLIAGATNTGKSVCINALIMSVLFKSTPDEVKFLIIDPKMVELHFYNDLPHLICPVVTDRSKVPGVLAWLLAEMERRYRLLSKVGAKNLLAFNEKVENKQITPETLNLSELSNDDEPIIVKKMPYIVLIIDELADLMMASAQEVETAITRLAQLARAVGIHMVLATQRPSVDVITGVIKANFPARIAFQVASKVDSRTILDENGADKLLGRGDLLFMDPRKSKVIRAQGAWVQDREIERVTGFIKNQRKAVYKESVLQSSDKKQSFGDFKRDEIYEEARRVVLETGQASVSMVQRRLGVGYTRAARLIDMMEEDGVVGPYRGAKPREILVERPKTAQNNESSESGGAGETS
ncbi:MAG: DNA translocase FtsK [Candidatus Omnitrophica bacterium]|nr:DNA translocase FtsK [Candidatus Omnitrophota bacterium]